MQHIKKNTFLTQLNRVAPQNIIHQAAWAQLLSCPFCLSKQPGVQGFLENKQRWCHPNLSAMVSQRACTAMEKANCQMTILDCQDLRAAPLIQTNGMGRSNGINGLF